MRKNPSLRRLRKQEREAAIAKLQDVGTTPEDVPKIFDEVGTTYDPALWVALMQNPNYPMDRLLEAANQFAVKTPAFLAKARFAILWGLWENPSLPLQFLEEPRLLVELQVLTQKARANYATCHSSLAQWKQMFRVLAEPWFPWVREHMGVVAEEVMRQISIAPLPPKERSQKHKKQRLAPVSFPPVKGGDPRDQTVGSNLGEAFFLAHLGGIRSHFGCAVEHLYLAHVFLECGAVVADPSKLHAAALSWLTFFAETAENIMGKEA